MRRRIVAGSFSSSSSRERSAREAAQRGDGGRERTWKREPSKATRLAFVGGQRREEAFAKKAMRQEGKGAVDATDAIGKDRRPLRDRRATHDGLGLARVFGALARSARAVATCCR